MTTTISNITSFTSEFSKRYNVSAIDFLWTSENGFDSFTVYSTKAEAGVLTMEVPTFDYNSEIDDLAIRQLLMTIIDDSEWNTENITEIGGTLMISVTDSPVFEGNVTSTSYICNQY